METDFDRYKRLNPEAADFNLNSYAKNLKLQRVIARSQSNKSKGPKFEEASVGRQARRDKRIAKCEADIQSTIGEYLKRRVKCSGMTRQNKLVRLGDLDSFNYVRVAEKIDLNCRDRVSGRTPLCEAVACGNFQITKFLCGECKVDVNKPTFFGKVTALHLAVIHNYRDIASLLLTYGANINALDRYGNSPLHYVHSKGVLALLLRFSADSLIRNSKGQLPFEKFIADTRLPSVMIKQFDDRRIRDPEVAYDLEKYTDHAMCLWIKENNTY